MVSVDVFEFTARTRHCLAMAKIETADQLIDFVCSKGHRGLKELPNLGTLSALEILTELVRVLSGFQKIDDYWLAKSRNLDFMNRTTKTEILQAAKYRQIMDLIDSQEKMFLVSNDINPFDENG